MTTNGPVERKPLENKSGQETMVTSSPYRQKKKKYGARVNVAKTQRRSSRKIEQVKRAGNIARVNKHENRNKILVGSLTDIKESSL